jgi:hypothetical protein
MQLASQEGDDALSHVVGHILTDPPPSLQPTPSIQAPTAAKTSISMSTLKCSSQGSLLIPCGLFFAHFTYLREEHACLHLLMYLESNNGRSHVEGLYESTRVTNHKVTDKPHILNLDPNMSSGTQGEFDSIHISSNSGMIDHI